MLMVVFLVESLPGVIAVSDSSPEQFSDVNLPEESGRSVVKTICNVFVVLVLLLLLVALLLPSMRNAPEAARRSASKNNLKQIGLALHNYHDTFKTLPPSEIVGEDGTLYHSWTMQIMPFLDSAGAPLFNEIDFNHPWNHSRNVQNYKKDLITWYLNPAISETSNNEGFGYAHYAGNSHIFTPNGTFRFEDCTDGSSNTLMVGEINANFKPWGQPGNVRDPALGINKGTNTFGSPFEGGAQFCLMDGSVRFVSENINPGTLKSLATPAAADVVGDF